MAQLAGWASWDEPREPRPVLRPEAAEQARYCPRCATRTIHAPDADADTGALVCSRCRYRAGDDLTDLELLLMADHFNLPLPAVDSRAVA